MSDVLGRNSLPSGAPLGQPKRSLSPVHRYRGLIAFWACIGTIVIVGGATLQVMGPPAPKPAPRAPHAPAVVAVADTKPLIPAPDPALQEPAPDFPGHNLPIKAPDGRTPMAVYAAPFPAADKHPRVVLVIDGAGHDIDQTEHLLNDLPGAVDVAFSAYMEDDRAGKLTALARKNGHECLASIPMMPSNFPIEDEGIRQLQEGPDAEANRLNLEWSLSRLTGCVGATGASDGFMGERFAQDGLGFSQVLEEVGNRGLLYLDPRTGSPALASATVTPISVVDLVIDHSPNPEQPVTADLIDQRLASLERLATERGVAIGLAGPPQPVLLERIAVWAHGLAARGVSLAPLTSVQKPPKATDGDAN
jgi:polysaccharide deacetylase 2 family uncharacterized protein YibQ